MTMQQLQSKYPAVPWFEYAVELLAPHARLEPTEQVIDVVPGYLEDFADLVTRTHNHVLANYALWRVARESAPMLGKRVQQAQREFEASLTGTSAKKPRWKECVGYVTESMHIAAGALYVRMHFDESAKANVVEMIQNIRKSFQHLLTQVFALGDFFVYRSE